MYFIFLDITALSESFTSLADSGETAENLGEVYALLERYLQISIWNCPQQGYGNDPSDLSDVAGTTCTNANKKATWKCRLRFRTKEQFKRIFKVTIAFP